MNIANRAGQNHTINIANRLFKNVAQFSYLGTAVKVQNLIQEEVKKILKSGNVFYHSVQNHLYSCVLSKNVNIRISTTVVFPVFFLWVWNLVSDVKGVCWGTVLGRIFRIFTLQGSLLSTVKGSRAGKQRFRPRQGKRFLFSVQTGCQAHPPSYLVDTSGSFPIYKVAGT
jgi:hypothetical protein